MSALTFTPPLPLPPTYAFDENTPLEELTNTVEIWWGLHRDQIHEQSRITTVILLSKVNSTSTEIDVQGADALIDEDRSYYVEEFFILRDNAIKVMNFQQTLNLTIQYMNRLQDTHEAMLFCSGVVDEDEAPATNMELILGYKERVATLMQDVSIANHIYIRNLSSLETPLGILCWRFDHNGAQYFPGNLNIVNHQPPPLLAPNSTPVGKHLISNDEDN